MAAWLCRAAQAPLAACSTRLRTHTKGGSWGGPTEPSSSSRAPSQSVGYPVRSVGRDVQGERVGRSNVEPAKHEAGTLRAGQGTDGTAGLDAGGPIIADSCSLLCCGAASGAAGLSA